MFGRTSTLIEAVPKNKGIVGQIRFWLLRRRIEKEAERFNICLGTTEFYQELAKWTGRVVFIVFSQLDDEPVKWTIETKESYFERCLERAETMGVGSPHL